MSAPSRSSSRPPALHPDLWGFVVFAGPHEGVLEKIEDVKDDGKQEAVDEFLQDVLEDAKQP